ncbi:NAD(P)-binding domain-containing protein, partial [Eubacteriales bacterium OttesenSCG-928-G02]|nr:NAD(P)-binding domain-containing protein [Eubacteriales bacterium OttesenSCG-928-G02]
MQNCEKTSNTAYNKHIAIIGAGNMANALVNGFINNNVIPNSEITIFDLNED